MTTLFVGGQYVVTFCGTATGAILCASFAEVRELLQNTYPNPGDETLAHLMAGSNWVTALVDDFPFHVEKHVKDGPDDYRVSVTRLVELTAV